MAPAFKRSGSAAAIVSWAGGLLTFGYVKYIMEAASTATLVASPVIVSAVLFIGLGMATHKHSVPAEVDELIDSLNEDVK